MDLVAGAGPVCPGPAGGMGTPLGVHAARRVRRGCATPAVSASCSQRPGAGHPWPALRTPPAHATGSKQSRSRDGDQELKGKSEEQGQSQSRYGCGRSLNRGLRSSRPDTPHVEASLAPFPPDRDPGSGPPWMQGEDAQSRPWMAGGRIWEQDARKSGWASSPCSRGGRRTPQQSAQQTRHHSPEILNTPPIGRKPKKDRHTSRCGGPWRWRPAARSQRGSAPPRTLTRPASAPRLRW